MNPCHNRSPRISYHGISSTIRSGSLTFWSAASSPGKVQCLGRNHRHSRIRTASDLHTTCQDAPASTMPRLRTPQPQASDCPPRQTWIRGQKEVTEPCRPHRDRHPRIFRCRASGHPWFQMLRHTAPATGTDSHPCNPHSSKATRSFLMRQKKSEIHHVRPRRSLP